MIVRYEYENIPGYTFDVRLDDDTDIKTFEKENQVKVISVKDNKIDAYEKALKDVEQIIKRKGNIISEYVRASNDLSVEADNDIEDNSTYEYLVALTEILKNIVVTDTLKKNGYIIDDNDEYKRYIKLD